MGGFMAFFYFLLFAISLVLVLRFVSKTSLVHKFTKLWQSLADRFRVYQFYKIPQFNEHFQENRLYRKISVYLDSLPSIEDSDFTNLFTGVKSNDIFFQHDAANSAVHDTFLSAKLSWTNEKSQSDGIRSFVLKINRSDKRRVFRQYFQHILTVADEIEQRNRVIKLYMNLSSENERWRSVPFTHPATFDTVVMDAELKNKIRSDLENFSKSKQYYHRLGRVWKRSFLLYGPSGTGKTSFVAAMARFLSYDVYDVDMSKVADDSDLKMLLLQTTPKSLIVVEDLDRFLTEKSTAVSLSGLLNFMDGIVSSCGEERVLVFTMNGKDQVDQLVLRPGRIDVHIHFPLCDFSAFKSLASTYLGLKEHKLFPQVEEIFHGGASLSPAEIGELMISNRSSPSRALKSVISALQTNVDSKKGANKAAQALTNSSSGRSVDESGEPGGVFCRESVHTVREFKKLYGLFRMGSRRKEESPLDSSSAEMLDGSRHERVNSENQRFGPVLARENEHGLKKKAIDFESHSQLSIKGWFRSSSPSALKPQFAALADLFLRRHKNYLIGAFKPSCNISITFSDAKTRKQVPLKKESGQAVLVPLFQSQENIFGKINIEPIQGKKVEHNGVKVELLGQIEMYFDRGNFYDFTSLVRELDVPGEIYERKTYPFEFSTVEMPYETYNGVNVRLRYVLKVTISRGYGSSIVEYQDFVVRNYSPPPSINNSIKMEVGIEDCLHIEFEYNKSKYHLKDVIIGKIYFLLVRIKIKNMDLEIRRRESTGSGPNTHVETETLAKFELMDGAPVRGESIPIRLFLSPYELTPTHRNINNKFSVKYYLNLVLVDEEDRRYFKQQEITIYRLQETS
ncbi:hypothetical protein ACFX12_042221 [Malus domestica]